MKRFLTGFLYFFGICFGLKSSAVTVSGNEGLAQSSSIKNIALNSTESILFWEESSSLENDFPRFYTKKFHRNGFPLWTETVEISSKNSPATQGSHTIVSDNTGGIYLAWESNQQNTDRTQIYIQHIDSTGKKLWGEVGRLLVKADGSQISPVLHVDYNGNLFIAWCDSRNDLSSNNFDIYIQKVNFAGEFLWGGDGKLISADRNDEFVAKILSSSEGISLIWNKVIQDPITEGEGFDFYSVKLSNAGEAKLTYYPSKFLSLPISTSNYELVGNILNDSDEGFYLTLSTPAEGNQLFLQHVSGEGLADWNHELSSPEQPLANTSLAATDLKIDSLGRLLITVNARLTDSILVSETLIDSEGDILRDSTYAYVHQDSVNAAYALTGVAVKSDSPPSTEKSLLLPQSEISKELHQAEDSTAGIRLRLNNRKEVQEKLQVETSPGYDITISESSCNPEEFSFTENATASMSSGERLYKQVSVAYNSSNKVWVCTREAAPPEGYQLTSSSTVAPNSRLALTSAEAIT